MPDASDLLAVARLLAQPPASDTALRRAVPTAYYALFHKLLRDAAQAFIGPGNETTAGYAILYRGFDHGHMRSVCEALQVPMLKARWRVALKRQAMSQQIQDFAATFITLQERRHTADYDPAAMFLASEVLAVVDEAERAIIAFDGAPPIERLDVLAMLMVKARG